MLILESPTKLVIQNPSVPTQVLIDFLTYTNKSVDFAIRNLKRARWLNAEAYAERMEELQAERKVCLLKEDETGLYTLSGLVEELEQLLQTQTVNQINYPKANLIPWKETPPPLRDYQIKAKDALLNVKHGSVEIGTGLGKSRIILEICKELGLKTVVMAPTTSIADQLYADFAKYFGKKYVGKYYGGKKDIDKRFTICIHASLARIDDDSQAFKAFSKAEVFIADESHLTPAETLSKVCLGLCANAPYRFFFSGTQIRGDGADMLLKGIVGRRVFTMTVEDGVDAGWLAKPVFRIINMVSNATYQSDDANKMTQTHLYYNTLVNEKAAQIANAAVTHGEGPVLILIDEIEQYRYLSPLLIHNHAFAHGPLNKDNRKFFPKDYKNPDNTKLVEKFNNNEIPILVGTSAISMGTDVRAVKTMIYLQGGKSPINVPQAIGRGTRKVPGKDRCTIIDFNISNVDMLDRHTHERARMYNNIYPDLEWL